MKKLFSHLFTAALGLSLSFGGLSGAATQTKSYREKLAEKITTLEYTLDVVMGKAETSIPPSALAEAKGIVIVHQYRVGFIIGGQAGAALLSARNPQTGDWGPPVMLNPGGLTFGLQAGANEINTVYLLMNDDAVRRAYSGRFDVGGDALAIAGPRNSETDRFDLFKAPVLVYTSLGGLYAGASVKAGWLSPDNKANRELYHTKFSTPEIAMSTWFETPPEAQSMMTRIRAYERGQ